MNNKIIIFFYKLILMEAKIYVDNNNITENIDILLKKYNTIDNIDNLMKKNLENIKNYQYERTNKICEKINDSPCEILKCKNTNNKSKNDDKYKINKNDFITQNFECIRKYQYDRININDT